MSDNLFDRAHRRAARRPSLERLEERDVPSTVAGSYADGVWRWDSTDGWGHLTAAQSSQLDVDDAGNVYAYFSGSGLWKWSDATFGWQLLSSHTLETFQCTAGGAVYVDYGVNGVWRWTLGGWQKLSNLDVAQFAASDNETFFGRFDVAGAIGTWRWTPAVGWQLLSGNRPDVLQTDDLGNLVGVYNTYIPAGQQGTWRWNAATGWGKLSSAVPGLLETAANGAVYEYRAGSGIWRYDPAVGGGFTQISSYTPASFSVFQATSNGGLFFIDSFTGNYVAWYYGPATGWAYVFNTVNTVGQGVAGKDGDIFLGFANYGTWLWGPTTPLTQLGSKTAFLLVSQT